MLSLMQQHLPLYALFFQSLEQRNALVGLHIPVVDAVDDEHGSFEVFDLVQVIPLIPEDVVVSAVPVLGFNHGSQCLIIPVLHLRIVGCILGTAETVFRQKVDVIPLPFQRRHSQPPLPVIIIPVGNARFRNDGLQTFHPGGSHCDTHGTQIGFGRHGDFTCTPVCTDFDVVRLIGKCPGPAAQPVDDRFEGQDFLTGSRQSVAF